jgi:hypothetical protein
MIDATAPAPDAVTMTAADAPAPADANAPEIIDLAVPIQRGKTQISSFALRKPKGRVLYGFSLPDIIDLKIATIYKLVPLISDPPLLQHEVENLEPCDLHEIGGTIKSFFMLKSERAMFEAMLALARPSS